MHSETKKSANIGQRIDGYDALNLRNTDWGVEIECLPEFGGRLNYLQLNINGQQQNMVDGFHHIEDLVNDQTFKNVLLFPFVNRLEDGEWEYNDQTLTFPVNEPDRNNRLHGFLFDESLEVINTQNNESGISIELKYEYRSKFDFYPFDVDVFVTYSIKQPSEFELSMSIENVGKDEAPVSFGWHPYFTLDEPVNNLELKTGTLQRVEVDDRLLPTGEKNEFDKFSDSQLIGSIELDTCFEHNSDRTATLYSSEQQLGIKLQQDKIFNYVQIFTPEDRKTIAMEPVSSNINAFQTGEGLLFIQPNQKINGSVNVSIIK